MLKASLGYEPPIICTPQELTEEVYQAMWKDPVVTETRSRREQYANQFDHNADAIFQDILQRQTVAGKKLVSFQHRVPVLSQVSSQEEKTVSNIPI